MSKKKQKPNCTKCSVIECFNLFDKSEDSEDAGNELYVYSLLGKKTDENENLAAHVCTNGTFLEASCFLTGEIPEDKENYLGDILFQVTRDFKASIFLAFSGHYRQAMQVLRCAFENIISGVYYYTELINLKKNRAADNEITELNKRVANWKKGGAETNINRSIEVLRRIGFLNFEEKKNWQTLYSLLSKFVHTPRDFVMHSEHKSRLKSEGDILCDASAENKGMSELESKIPCAAATCFNEKQLIEWSNCYQRIFAVLLKTMAEFHPEAFFTEAGRNAVAQIKAEIENYEGQILVSKGIKQTLDRFKP